MSLAQFLSILLARKRMIILAVIASLLGAVVVVALVPARYKASSRLMLDLIKPDPVTGQVLGNQFVRAYTKTQTELIRDYKVAGQVVDELGWTSNPAMVETYEVANDPNGARRRMAQLIIDNTEAKLIEGSNILEITYTAWSADSAKAVTDMIRKSYVDASLSFKRESAGQSADWYQLQTDKARRLLTIAEQEKTAFERQNGLIMQADKTDLESARLTALSGQMPAQAGSGYAAPSSTSSPSAMEVAKLDAQITTVQRTLGPNHPGLQDLLQRRSALAAQAAREQSIAASSSSSARQAAASAAASAAGANRQAYEAQKAKVIASRDKVSELKQLQDEVDLRRDQYIKSGAKAADLRLQADTADAGLTLLGNAVAPEKPAFPNIPLILFGSIGFGLALGILAALLTELLQRRIRLPRDLEDAANDIPLLAVISDAKANRQGAGLFSNLRKRFGARASDKAFAT